MKAVLLCYFNTGITRKEREFSEMTFYMLGVVTTWHS